MDRKTANRLWREIARGAPDGAPNERILHEFAQRVEALTIAGVEARRAKLDATPAPKPTGCWCARCDMEHNVTRTRMSVCNKCGDKRCPRAEDHRNECSKDAERYRWLRDRAYFDGDEDAATAWCVYGTCHGDAIPTHGDDLDAEVDARMLAAPAVERNYER